MPSTTVNLCSNDKAGTVAKGPEEQEGPMYYFWHWAALAQWVITCHPSGNYLHACHGLYKMKQYWETTTMWFWLKIVMRDISWTFFFFPVQLSYEIQHDMFNQGASIRSEHSSLQAWHYLMFFSLTQCNCHNLKPVMQNVSDKCVCKQKTWWFTIIQTAGVLKKSFKHENKRL